MTWWFSSRAFLGVLQQSEQKSNLLDNLIQYFEILFESKEFCSKSGLTFGFLVQTGISIRVGYFT
ncbi:hypothetical protein EHQ83_15420 [Leptospira yasudae]|uniref:Uncharacterized protein n=1 Tax=Leptospira yasudae TaxID=2202201 RepID=A0A6N4QQX7_9LEPT|nr:hypothetical protein EHQ72_16960 [Leptospira yasudae]TGL77835.1 hypothetical protein EHQ77_14645 [Leptospira yasudae]TGL81242.1 hypothetical protein EHQ83_15420 [Leptospira yasudae]